MSRNDRAKEFAEPDVERREGVQARRHMQDMVGCLGRLARQALHQVRDARGAALRPHVGYAQQVGDAPLVDSEESVEHGGDEDGAALMRFGA